MTTQDNKTFQLTSKERATIRRALIAAGELPRGLSDLDLHTLHAEKCGGDDTPAATPAAPADKPAAPAPAPEKKTTPAAPEKPASDTGGKLAAGIQELLEKALATPQLDEARIIELIAEHGTQRTITTHNINVTTPAGDNHKINGAHPVLTKIIDVLSANENCYLYGDAGGGKTTLGSQTAAALGVDFYFSPPINDKYDLLGFVDAGGKYHATELYKMVSNKKGGVFLLDECDVSNPAAVKAFNGALENREIVFPNGERFTINPDTHRFIFAANTIGLGATATYVAGFQLDRSTLDRFIPLYVDYDAGIEAAMCKGAWLSAGGDKDSTAPATWLECVISFRALLKDRKIMVLCTPRASRQGAKLLAKGWALRDVKDVILYKHLSEDQKRQMGV